MKIILKSFLAGFLSTLAFHQGIIFLLYIFKLIPISPYNITPTEPFGVPSFISLAFFGGLWGILIWQVCKDDYGKKHWVKTVLLGALGPTAVAFLVVFPIKGIRVEPIMIPLGLILNGAWGAGNSFFMILFNKAATKS